MPNKDQSDRATSDQRVESVRIEPMPTRRERPAMIRLEPITSFDRPLSVSEYYHASLGSSGGIVQPVEATFILEGDGADFEEKAWRQALDKASMANPGSRVRLVGCSLFARWRSDGPMPRLRIVERTDWDGTSCEGAGFLRPSAFSLEEGPAVELLLVNRSPRGRLVVMRTPHAVMDGRGALHFLAEVFRALRGEPLLGSNAPFTDVDVMRKFDPKKTISRPIPTGRLTGEPEGEESGDEWRRITLDVSSRDIVSRVAQAAAEHMHLHSDLPALFTVPVDIRRHVPGLVSTANFFGVVFVPLQKGESAEVFRERFRFMLAGRMECYYLAIGQLFKILPRRWIDRMLARYSGYNPLKKHIHTLGISNVGRMDPALYSWEGYSMRSCFVIPLQGTNLTLMGAGDGVEIAINIPKVFTSNGRFDAFVDHLRQRLIETDRR